jgi:hypothetical protein
VNDRRWLDRVVRQRLSALSRQGLKIGLFGSPLGSRRTLRDEIRAVLASAIAHYG